MRPLLELANRLLRGTAAGPNSIHFATLTGIILACGFFYGGVMGSFGGLFGNRFGQALISGVKVPLLLLATFALSVPSFFILNTLAGVRADFPQAVRALIGGQAGFTLVLASFAPYTLLWYVSFDSYRDAVLFNGLMFALASLTAQGLLRRHYRGLIVRNPRHRWLLRAWLLLYSFVGIQMAWTLRPFIGEPGSPLQFFRDESWGNAYIIVGRMLWQGFFR